MSIHVLIKSQINGGPLDHGLLNHGPVNVMLYDTQGRSKIIRTN